MTYLTDVNIWIALTMAVTSTIPAPPNGSGPSAPAKLVFCCVSELGFLRLITNPHVIGNDVLSPTKAWFFYDQSRADQRVAFSPENANFNQQWCSSADYIPAGPNAWTDAYLALLAAHANATVITLDRKFLSLGGAAIQCLR